MSRPLQKTGKSTRHVELCSRRFVLITSRCVGVFPPWAGARRDVRAWLSSFSWRAPTPRLNWLLWLVIPWKVRGSLVRGRGKSGGHGILRARPAPRSPFSIVFRGRHSIVSCLAKRKEGDQFLITSLTREIQWARNFDLTRDLFPPHASELAHFMGISHSAWTTRPPLDPKPSFHRTGARRDCCADRERHSLSDVHIPLKALPAERLRHGEPGRPGHRAPWGRRQSPICGGPNDRPAFMAHCLLQTLEFALRGPRVRPVIRVRAHRTGARRNLRAKIRAMPGERLCSAGLERFGSAFHGNSG